MSAERSWRRDPTRRYCQWPASDAPLALSRDTLRALVQQTVPSILWDLSEEEVEKLATGISTAAANLFIEWREVGTEPDMPSAGLLIGRERKRAILSLAGTLRNRGLEPHEIAGCLFVLNDARCRPRLPDAEISSIAASIGAKPAARPLVPEAIAA